MAISLGFPLGYLILTPLTESLIVYFQYDWQIVQRLYGLITLFQLIIFTPLFTDKHAIGANTTPSVVSSSLLKRNHFMWTNVYFLKSKQVMHLTRILWLIGLFSISCANNSVQINLNGFFETQLGLSEQEKNSYFIFIGVSDVCVRLLLAGLGWRILDHLSLCFIAASLAGIFVSASWAGGSLAIGNILFCIGKWLVKLKCHLRH